MTVCAGMLVKDEEDIVETTILHLLTQVDEVVVLDNLSTDATSEILARLSAADPRVTVRLDEEVGYYQSAKMTALAQEARERGHGWFVPVDADEIWYSGDGRRIADFLDGISRDAVVVKAAILNHVATDADPADDPNPVRRLGWRQREPLAYQWWKVACRCRPDLEIDMGNHGARTHGPGREERGLEIRHFPYRSADQFVRKAVNGLAAYRAAPELFGHYGNHWVSYGEHIERAGEQGGRDWFHEHFFIRDPETDASVVYSPAPVSVYPEQPRPTGGYSGEPTRWNPPNS